uniref:Lipocalin/cytosolic fatty-acid binding domain-containing protein n=1 Tax=Astyanax mexicanus TaxID=7994 RepID=A0A8B9GU33_ASTMX
MMSKRLSDCLVILCLVVSCRFVSCLVIVLLFLGLVLSFLMIFRNVCNLLISAQLFHAFLFVYLLYIYDVYMCPVSLSGYGTDNDMRVVDVKYDEYCLMYSFKTKEGSSYILNQMYSRTQKPSQEVLKKFTKFSLDQGILPENIRLLLVMMRNTCCS